MRISRAFVKAVFDEVKAIRSMGMDKEKDRLDSKTLDGKCGGSCIYAQLSNGSFGSQYAIELKHLFATHAGYGGDWYINTKPKSIKDSFLTPLEIVVYFNQWYVSKWFIPYIKGEIHSLPSMASFVRNNQYEYLS